MSNIAKKVEDLVCCSKKAKSSERPALLVRYFAQDDSWTAEVVPANDHRDCIFNERGDVLFASGTTMPQAIARLNELCA